MIRTFLALLLITCCTVYAQNSNYKGSQAYNHANYLDASVNTATGTFHFSYTLIKMTGKQAPFTINLTYGFKTAGAFGLPNGWALDLDHVDYKTANIAGQQWLIDPLWHDETLYSSGLKYFNLHGTRFEDKGKGLPVPEDESLTYRYQSQHKDGSVKYFSPQGLLIYQRDRFANAITFEYNEPINSVHSARLVAITDNYGNRYTFDYEPGILIVRYPDERQQRVYFSPSGVTTIMNPLNQRYDFKYVNFDGYTLLKTVTTPSGMISELAYDTIPFKCSTGVGSLPVVSRYRKYDESLRKTYFENHYHYTKGNNYTGYPLYTMSDSTDSLMDSNNFNYRYKVEVVQVQQDPTGSKIHHQIFTYNFLHLPVEVRTLKGKSNFIKVDFTYEISPFKYSRSTNYDKPTSIIHSSWNDNLSAYIPSNRTDQGYDLFGNKITASHWVYNREASYWRPLRTVNHDYFTDHFSLRAQTIDRDRVSGKAKKTQYRLSPSKKTHASKAVFAMEGESSGLWYPWQQLDYFHDDSGREIFRQLKWIAKGVPGIQKSSKKTHYLFDKQSAVLTTIHESSLGNLTREVLDTRNNQRIARISALGEKTEFRYNSLGQLTQHIDPEGNIHAVEHYVFADDGLNATVLKSPLGFKQRTQRDAGGRIIKKEELINDTYQVIEEKEYNAFGKIAVHKNRFGHATTYEYDDQKRLIESIDPWSNKTHFIYDDNDLSQQAIVNGHQHRKIKKLPWLLTTKTTHYPMAEPRTAINRYVEKNGFNELIREEVSLFDMNSASRHSIVRKNYQYDADHHKNKIDFYGFNGISLSKSITYDLFKNVYGYTKTQNDNGSLSLHRGYNYLYNTDNQLERVVSPGKKPLITRHRYDKNGREVARELPDGHVIKQQYNPRGLITASSWTRRDKPYQTLRSYDADGRLTQRTDSNGQSQQYQYDLAGNLTGLTYNQHRQQRYHYDDKRRLVRQENIGQRVLNYHYDDKDKGKLSAIKSDNSQILLTYGKDNNGMQGQLLTIERDIAGTDKTTERFSYDAFGRVAKEKVSKAEAPLLTKTYQFLPRGELIRQTSEAGKKTTVSTYRHDALHRLIDESHHSSSGEQRISYQYDGNNNLLKEQRANETIHRTYNDLDQLVSTKNAASTNTIRHDDNGRIQSDHQGNQYQYDDLGLLTSVTNAQGKVLSNFYYLPDGMLAQLHNDHGIQTFHYHLNGRAQSVVTNGKLHDYIQLGNKYVGVLRKGVGEQLFIANQSTTARLSVDANKEQTTRFYHYEGYGKSLDKNQESAPGDFHWNQELKDKATELVYLRHRFYHPQLKRFISRDDQHVDNRYAYALANPIDFVDPEGQNAKQILTYTFGGLIALAGLVTIFLATPLSPAFIAQYEATIAAATGTTAATAATSQLHLDATIAASAFAAVGGGMLIGSQAALDGGQAGAEKAFQISGILMSVVSGLVAIYAVAPLIRSTVVPMITRLTSSFTQAGATAATTSNTIGFDLVEYAGPFTLRQVQTQGAVQRFAAQALRDLVAEASDFPPFGASNHSVQTVETVAETLLESNKASLSSQFTSRLSQSEPVLSHTQSASEATAFSQRASQRLSRSAEFLAKGLNEQLSTSTEHTSLLNLKSTEDLNSSQL